MVGAFVLGRGSMNHEGLEVHQGHEGDRGNIDREEVARQVIGMAIKIHRAVGPGLFEHTYQDCLEFELERAGLRFESEVELHLFYEGNRFPRCYRADIIVENAVVLEIKTVDKILPIHETQVLTYLRLSGCHIGLLLNFNTVLLKHGLRRFVA
jgi:GxxExxY protein